MGKKNELKRPLGQDAEPVLAQKETGSAAERPSKKARVEESRSLFVRSLPPAATSETLTEFFSEHFPVKHATVVLDPKTKTSRGYGFVTFTDKEDVDSAKERLQGAKFDGRRLLLEVAEPRHRRAGTESADATAKKEERQAALAEARKAPKLIVRNLPWSIKHSDQLAKLFQSYGKIKYADLPSNKGKLKGFGFVTLRGKKNAEKAIEGLNGKTVDGRTIAVDWAVDKQIWEEQQKEEEEEKAPEPEADQDEEGSKASESEDEKSSDEEEDEDLRNFMKNHMENLEDEDSDAEKPDQEGSDDDAEDDDEDASDEAPTAKKPTTTDNNSTLFIRNLPFTTTDAELKSHFEQFGRVRYARIVMDRATDRPAGTGFVCFASVDDSKACLRGAPRPQQTNVAKKQSLLQNEMADEEGKYTIDGRIVQVSQAVSKDEATRLTETGVAARQGKDKDKRRLYLLQEGIIPKGSPMHAMLAPTEVKIRDQSADQRKKLIQSNPSLHLSLTRLAVRNMPRSLDSKKLKALAREAVVGFAKDVKEGRREPLSKEETSRGGEDDKKAEHQRRERGKGVVKQAKIVFENREGSKVAETDGAGRSRGYGFIEYSSHRWALMGLRWLNGHALKNDAGKDQRLIVEFAIENAQVVARRKDLQVKSLANNPTAPEYNGGKAPFNSKSKGHVPKSKDFSVSKDKRQKPDGKGKGKDAKHGGNTTGDDGSAKDALHQKIIGRKRMVRKKKAQSRG
ncbi:RNA-binding domain-containing protein [Xylariomycetidae sp. FL0641]|nr:RNA-binding domain-containing protein [Xylariomycetidae sp. FL0641]